MNDALPNQNENKNEKHPIDPKQSGRVGILLQKGRTHFGHPWPGHDSSLLSCESVKWPLRQAFYGKDADGKEYCLNEREDADDAQLCKGKTICSSLSRS
jgi:hypothetical protein